MIMNMNMVTIISFWYSIADMKQAEKLKSCKMKGEWLKNDDWKKNDEGWWFQAVEVFSWQTDNICECRVAFATEKKLSIF